MGLEGAMLVARSYGEPRRFEEIATRLLRFRSSLTPSAAFPPPGGRAGMGDSTLDSGLAGPQPPQVFRFWSIHPSSSRHMSAVYTCPTPEYSSPLKASGFP